ncbi:hypothetical protein, partial [Streptomyces sp. bgisy082]
AAGVGFPGRSLLVMPTYTVALVLLVTALTGRRERAGRRRAAVPVRAPGPDPSRAGVTPADG